MGRVRTHHEDCIVVGGWVGTEPMPTPRRVAQALDTPLVCLVLDGMGGHLAGEVAAREAAQFLARMLPSCASEQAVTECVRAANAHLYRVMRGDERYIAMGATVAGIRIASDGIVVFNVGDSRVYRVQDGLLAQLTIDDVPLMPLGQRAARTGLLTQSLGGVPYYTQIGPHLCAQPAAPGTYLVCSDGLYDALRPEAIEAAIDDDVEASVARLLDAALAAHASDNVSIVLVRVAH
jgi:PPM family protein phosphatase